MQYLMLMYHSEADGAKIPPAEMAVWFEKYGKFTEEIKKSGNYLGGNPLKPTNTATTVRVRDSKRVVTDGPFAETKEQLGGYYLIEATDLDQAISIAARIPGALYGSIEVRPIMPMTQAVQA
jgi:hypothetical protein